MLVPTTWLNRDYAHPVQYILGRWFDVRYVVEDADASWFSDALVRTAFMAVAQRFERRESAFSPAADRGYLHLAIGAAAADERSVIGRFYPQAQHPDLAFADNAAIWRTARRVPLDVPVTSESVRTRPRER